MNSVSKDSYTVTVDNIPAGGVIMWTKPEIPEGWALCDGTNGRPDLRDKFVRGAHDLENLRITGGSDTVQITSDHLPEHTHIVDDPGHHHAVELISKIDDTQSNRGHGNAFAIVEQNYNAETRGAFTGITIEPTGKKNPALNIVPAFYALYFIIKLES